MLLSVILPASLWVNVAKTFGFFLSNCNDGSLWTVNQLFFGFKSKMLHVFILFKWIARGGFLRTWTRNDLPKNELFSSDLIYLLACFELSHFLCCFSCYLVLHKSCIFSGIHAYWRMNWTAFCEMAMRLTCYLTLWGIKGLCVL